MKPVRDLGRYPRVHDLRIPHPLRQHGVVWSILDTTILSAKADWHPLRYNDPGDILELLSDRVGPPTGVRVLGNIVVGATDWAGVPFERQYDAVTNRAGAFVGGAMNYLRLIGPNAGVLLDMLTPRDMTRLGVNRAAFTLFTTPAGTIDTEAVVLRVAEDEYLLSCGGPMPSWLPEAQSLYPDVQVEQAGVASFNIKGPLREQAMAELIVPADRVRWAALKPFHVCRVHTVSGSPVWVLKTVVGVEMWGDGDALRESWLSILDRPALITPCAWDLLDVYRLECDSFVFGVHPLELHGGTSLWEIGYERMAATTKRGDFIGRDGLRHSRHNRNLWLGGLVASRDVEPLPVGEEIFTEQGAFCGYVTTSAFSPKHNRTLAFSHLMVDCLPGRKVVIGGDTWSVTDAPFTSSLPPQAGLTS